MASSIARQINRYFVDFSGDLEGHFVLRIHRRSGALANITAFVQRDAGGGRRMLSGPECSSPAISIDLPSGERHSGICTNVDEGQHLRRKYIPRSAKFRPVA